MNNGNIADIPGQVYLTGRGFVCGEIVGRICTQCERNYRDLIDKAFAGESVVFDPSPFPPFSHNVSKLALQQLETLCAIHSRAKKEIISAISYNAAQEQNSKPDYRLKGTPEETEKAIAGEVVQIGGKYFLIKSTCTGAPTTVVEFKELNSLGLKKEKHPILDIDVSRLEKITGE